MKSVILGVALSCSNGTCATSQEMAVQRTPVRTVVQAPVRFVQRVRTKKPARTFIKRIFCR